MLYDKSKGIVSEELFKNPTCEFRGAPFWAWNGRLDPNEIDWQTSIFKEMGFGGYHMHVRTGLEDEYMGETFNRNIAACVQSSVKNDMLAWLYDEDRWPSGFAGGLVTRDKAMRIRYVTLTKKRSDVQPQFNEDGILTDGQKLLAAYRIKTAGERLVSYERTDDATTANWFAYLCIEKETSWHNNTAYVDTMNKTALDRFADVTYGGYQKNVGEYLGNRCPAIFTDEPQLYSDGGRWDRPWTDDFADTYRAKYGEDILDKLPELYFEQPAGHYSVARYRFWDHVAARFAEAFADNLGQRARDVGLLLTGHMMNEPGLQGQTKSTGECMRHYRGFGIPGIDMLCSNYEFTTAKQCQSMVCQYDKPGMLSELYGVSKWNYDFRMYKIHGDWQAALGVTVRVPHLSMMCMKGEAKRDYPASIFYQSPWYAKYGVVEDHFARVNTAMTNGRQVCDIAVIHPIESYWLAYGYSALGAKERLQQERRFNVLPKWLLKHGLDYHYIDECLLPELCPEADNPLPVGKMSYKAVVLPAMTTIRSTTLDRLLSFAAKGGKVIVMGDLPTLVDAMPSDRISELAAVATRIKFDKTALWQALEPYRKVGFYDVHSGEHTDNIIYSLKEKADGLWLFASRAGAKRFPNNDVEIRQDLNVVVDGEWIPTLWNTLNGDICDMDYTIERGKTKIKATMYNHDSLLIRLQKDPLPCLHIAKGEFGAQIVVQNDVPYTLSEPNVMLLDKARYALDDGAYSLCAEDILALDNKCRRKLGLTSHGGSICQPWAAVKQPAEHTIRLQFNIYSSITYPNPELALEDADLAKITFNGQQVSNEIVGWYVDKTICKVRLPELKKGKNVLEIVLPFGENTYTEWCYLLGNFGVKVCGASKRVTKLPKTLRYGKLYDQGFPFYGGKITYHSSFKGNGGLVQVHVPVFRSALLEVECNGVSKDLAYAPYCVELLSNNGINELNLTAYVSRENAFGPVHHRTAKSNSLCYGPNIYRARTIFERTPVYMLVKEGILETPTVAFIKN